MSMFGRVFRGVVRHFANPHAAATRDRVDHDSSDNAREVTVESVFDIRETANNSALSRPNAGSLFVGAAFILVGLIVTAITWEMPHSFGSHDLPTLEVSLMLALNGIEIIGYNFAISIRSRLFFTIISFFTIVVSFVYVVYYLPDRLISRALTYVVAQIMVMNIVNLCRGFRLRLFPWTDFMRKRV